MTARLGRQKPERMPECTLGCRSQMRLATTPGVSFKRFTERLAEYLAKYMVIFMPARTVAISAHRRQCVFPVHRRVMNLDDFDRQMELDR